MRDPEISYRSGSRPGDSWRSLTCDATESLGAFGAEMGYA
jgi:hypothetical protein